MKGDRMQTERIGLAHGNGGRWMRQLIDELIAPALDSNALDTRHDSATLAAEDGAPVMTTDGFTVQPLEFPGGNIGSLAIHGTVNDLAVAGARPRALSLNLIIEEGLEMDLLRRVLTDAGKAAREAGAAIVTGDTKVVRRGEGGGLYLVTTGIGYRPTDWRPDLESIRPGDRILVSGPVGDHGISVMLAREEFGMRGDLRSDSGSVLPLAEAAWPFQGLRFLRDPTRGGLAEVLHEVRRQSGCGVRVSQSAVPVREPVLGVCEMLGYDPWYLACEGRAVAVVAPDEADRLLGLWRSLPEGTDAAIIGTVEGDANNVLMETPIGGERLIEELEDDPLPRIC
jgi:hydrogenase expression/formation protein HypE